MSGDRSEHAEDEENDEGKQPQGAETNDLPTVTRREAEEEMLETPAAP